MKIVTDGRVYRVRDDDGSFMQVWESSPSGHGLWVDFETRFCWFAKRAMLRCLKDEALEKQNETVRIWHEVPAL